MKPAEILTPEKLKAAREELGLSRAQLAAAMGVDYLSVRRWEQPGVQITRLTELAFLSVLRDHEGQKQEEAEMAGQTVDEAIEFAKEMGITVTEHDLGVLVLQYPSGETKAITRDDPRAAWTINDMACNLL